MKFALTGLTSVYSIISELATGLTKLSFADNFKSFEVKQVFIKAGAIKQFANKLNKVPSQYVIVSQIGGGVVARPREQAWDKGTIYLKNYGTEDVTINIIFIE